VAKVLLKKWKLCLITIENLRRILINSMFRTCCCLLRYIINPEIFCHFRATITSCKDRTYSVSRKKIEALRTRIFYAIQIVLFCVFVNMLYLSWGPVSVLDWDNWVLDWVTGFRTETGPKLRHNKHLRLFLNSSLNFCFSTLAFCCQIQLQNISIKFTSGLSIYRKFMALAKNNVGKVCSNIVRN